jgi:ribonuclease D
MTVRTGKAAKAKQGEAKPPVYVDSSQGLVRLAHSLLQQSAIAVDTESNPLFAYREQLCLIQISTAKRDYIVDPLAGIDLNPLVPVFADPGILKIFHDAEFDVLMLKRAHAFEIGSIFDTKVAVTSLGYSSIGLAPLLKMFYGVTLDKKFQRSDWGKRPLTDGQLDYASKDTHYLLPLAEKLRKELHDKGELNCLEVAAECRRLEGLIPEHRVFNPDEFIKIKGSDGLNGKERRVLRELFIMRHQIADQLDRPAFKVLSNELLIRLARLQPESDDSLRRQKILSHKVREQRGAEVLSAIRRARKLNPLTDVRPPRSQNEVGKLTDEQRMAYEALRVWRKTAAAARSTEASLVLLRSTMLELSRLRPRPQDLAALTSSGLLEPWRVRYYGDDILHALNEQGGRRNERRRRRGKRV